MRKLFSFELGYETSVFNLPILNKGFYLLDLENRNTLRDKETNLFGLANSYVEFDASYKHLKDLTDLHLHKYFNAPPSLPRFCILPFEDEIEHWVKIKQRVIKIYGEPGLKGSFYFCATHILKG